MAEGSGKAGWEQTSNLMALIANCNRDPKKSRPFKPADFNPFINQKKQKQAGAIVINKENIFLLREAFTGKTDG